MNRSVSIIIIGIIVSFICFYHESSVIRHTFSLSLFDLKMQEKKISSNAPFKPVRESITFILGEDREDDNRYYEEATNYYTNHTEGKTNYIITTCRSLLDVSHYLAANTPANKLPWGLINLVSHGNQWTGLSVKVTPDSKRSTAARIEEYIQNNTFHPLPKISVDNKTEICLHGCGVGNNKALVNNLARAFCGEEQQPVVRASKLFEYYASRLCNDIVQSEHYLANSWFICYPMDEALSLNTLANTLHDQYPDATINWHRALQTTRPEWIGDAYHYTFQVPVKWVIPVATDSLPNLSTTENQLTWLQKQKQILNDLALIDIPVEKFRWSFTNIYVDSEDGTKSPAIWVRGYSTVLCVLQALTKRYDHTLALQKPFVPNLNNTTYYYTTAESRLLSYKTK